MWVKFTKDYDYRPTNQTVVEYKKGMHLNVPEKAVEEIIAGGFAEETGHVAQAGDATDGTQEIRTNGAPAKPAAAAAAPAAEAKTT